VVDIPEDAYEELTGDIVTTTLKYVNDLYKAVMAPRLETEFGRDDYSLFAVLSIPRLLIWNLERNPGSRCVSYPHIRLEACHSHGDTPENASLTDWRIWK